MSEVHIGNLFADGTRRMEVIVDGAAYVGKVMHGGNVVCFRVELPPKVMAVLHEWLGTGANHKEEMRDGTLAMLDRMEGLNE